jgi:hypothetical protein
MEPLPFGPVATRARLFKILHVGEAYGLKCGVESPSLRVFPAQVGDGLWRIPAESLTAAVRNGGAMAGNVLCACAHPSASVPTN